MSTPATNTLSALNGKTPMIGPDGSFYAVPLESKDDAIQHNYKPAVLMKSDMGDLHAVPHDSVSDALAHKWTLTQTSGSPTEVPEWYGFTPSNIANNLYEGAKSVVQGVGAVAKDLVQNPNWVQGDNSTLHKFVEAPMQAQVAKGAQELADPNASKVSAYGHIMAGSIPVVGPLAASLGEQAGTGDVGGAGAQAAALVATPALAGKAVDLVKAGAGKAVLLGRTPEEAYQSALKPSTTINPAKVDAMVRTGLDQKIPVSPAGVDKLGSLVDDLNDKIKAEIAVDPSRPIDPNAVAARTAPLKTKFANQVNPSADLSAIDSSKLEFLANQGAVPAKPAVPPQPTGVLDAKGNPVMTAGTPAVPAQPAPPMAASDAQTMKQGTYAQLKGKVYGELKSATIESQKSLARGLKEELANAFPELSNLNAQESKLLDLQPILEKAIQRQGNHQLGGIGTPIVAGATKAVTGSSGLATVAGAIKAVVDNPIVKSKLAIYLNRAGVPYQSAVTRIRNYSAALGVAASSANIAAPEDQDNQSAK